MMRAFRFAVQSFNAESAAQWKDRARAAEDLGYSALHLADHLLGPGPALAKTNHPPQNLAAVPAMATAAAVTGRLKVGCRVFCVDYRPAVVLIKEAMTLDLLSDGRLEFGIGAGWLAEEYRAMGYRLDSAGRRIERLGHVVAAYRAFASGAPLEIINDDVEWRGFAGLPQPVQRPHPPLLIGGGAPRILRLAGREADIVSLNFNIASGVIGAVGVQSSVAEATDRKIGWIRDGAGARFADIELEVGAYFTTVTDKPAPVVAQFAAAFGIGEAEMREHPHALIGSVDSIAETLEARRERYGISYVTVPDAAMHAFAPVVARLAGK
jgi:probable F420-dependent oxidoreductase